MSRLIFAVVPVLVMARPREFREEDKIKLLLWCDRHCCLCRKNAGPDIEIAHIDNKAGNDIENGIPLCYDCHAKIGHYNREHPKGNKYRPEELKARREQIFEEYTRHLVPPVHFYLTQKRIDGTDHKPPFVGFHLQHLGDSLPVHLRVEMQVMTGERQRGMTDDATGYYTGKVKWNLNPRTFFWGGLSLPTDYFEKAGTEELKAEVRVIVIDQFEREHKLLPQCYRWVTSGNFWNLEPQSFMKWE